jgi:hypothetical protein
MLDVKILGLTKLQASFDQITPVLQDQLRVFMARFGLMVRDRVRQNILERFKVVTGEFPSAVQVEQTETVQQVQSRIFIDTLPWAAIQERGGKTPPHTIEVRAANALAWLSPSHLGLSGGPKSSAYAFAMKVNHPGSNIPERTYMRLALVQMRQPFEGGIRELVDRSIDQTFGVAAE